MRRNVILHKDFNQITNEKASVARRPSKFRLVERVKRQLKIGARLQWEYNQATENATKISRGGRRRKQKTTHLVARSISLMTSTTIVVLRCKVEQRQSYIFTVIEYSFVCLPLNRGMTLVLVQSTPKQLLNRLQYKSNSLILITFLVSSIMKCIEN